MKRRLFWIVELFIWFLILLLISSGIIFAKYNYKKNFNTYQIFLPDVDGLVVGSPVRLMGIQIGHVSQLDIVGEDVYVKFIITDNDVKIPYGSSATVEFSGLGGSKSLELYPPTPGIRSNKFIVSRSPKRIHDSLGLLSDMFKKAADITYSVSNFMNKIGIIKRNKTCNKFEQSKSSNKFFGLNCLFDKAQKQCDKFNCKLKKMKEGRHGQNCEQSRRQSQSRKS